MTSKPTTKTSTTGDNSSVTKPSLADRLYEAWEFAGNLGRRKQ